MTKCIFFFIFQFTQLKDTIRKKDESSDSDKAGNLQNTVAEFGAKIQALNIDVNTLKEDSSAIKTTQQNEKVRVDTLRDKIDTAINASQSSFNANVHNETTAWMKNQTDRFLSDMKNVSDQLKSLNETFSPRINSIETEMHDHQTKLDGLTESFANVSSHVDSIESEWPKFKQSNQKYDSITGTMSKDIDALKTNILNLTAAVNNVQRNLMAQQRVTSSSDQVSKI